MKDFTKLLNKAKESEKKSEGKSGIEGRRYFEVAINRKLGLDRNNKLTDDEIMQGLEAFPAIRESFGRKQTKNALYRDFVKSGRTRPTTW